MEVAPLDEYLSVIFQHSLHTEPPDEPYVITVWHSDAANRYLSSNTPAGQYAVKYRKPEDYQQLQNRQIIQQVWNDGFIPVEILKGDRGYFRALNPEAVGAGAPPEFQLLNVAE